MYGSMGVYIYTCECFHFFFFQKFYRMVEHLFSISCLREDGTLDSRYKYILCLLLLLLFISFLPVSNG